jgi:hypothetical protein
VRLAQQDAAVHVEGGQVDPGDGARRSRPNHFMTRRRGGVDRPEVGKQRLQRQRRLGVSGEDDAFHPRHAGELGLGAQREDEPFGVLKRLVGR